MSSSPPQLSEIDELGYDGMSNDIDRHKPRPNGFESETTVSSLTTGISSTEASSPTVSSSGTATGNNMHNIEFSQASSTSSQGRYDNTVNQYDLIKEASRAHIKSRTVCVAIPVNRKDGTVLMVTSRKHDTKWICEFQFDLGDGSQQGNWNAVLKKFPFVLQSRKVDTRKARRMLKQPSERRGKKVRLFS
jgi:hypothetical protein